MRKPMNRVLAAAALVAVSLLFSGSSAWATLLVHYDASDGSTVLNAASSPAGPGEAVEFWVDKAAAGGVQNAVRANGSPTYNMAGGPFGQPVLDFDGAEACLRTAATQARTVVMVHQWDTSQGGTWNYLLDARTGLGNGWVANNSIGSNWTELYVHDSPAPVAPGNLYNDTWQISTLVSNVTFTDDLNLFSRVTNNECGRGRLAEVLVFDAALSESERLSLVASLDEKWFQPSPGTIWDVSAGKSYAYFQTVPGQPLPGSNYYFDDLSGLHSVHGAGLGVFDTGDLTDGILGIGTTDANIPSPIVAVRGDGSGDFPVDVIIDLADVFAVDNIVIGTSLRGTNGTFGNFAPDDVSIGLSLAGDEPDDFLSLTNFILWATDDPLGLGHHEMVLDMDGVLARYVMLSFDGQPTEKYVIDEITVNGFTPLPADVIPEPATLSLLALGGLGLLRRRRKSSSAARR